MPTNTIRLHRVLRAPAERIYRAFLDAEAMAKWLPPNGFTGNVHQMDAKVGGSYRMSFTNFNTDKSHSFGGTYLELVPHERIRYSDKFDDPNLPGEMLTTITLREVFCGAALNVVKAYPPLFLPKPVISAGKSRWFFSQSSSRRRSPMSRFVFDSDDSKTEHSGKISRRNRLRSDLRTYPHQYKATSTH
jgi:uncharacterized protein YndB with AHSA1/START domain